VKLLPGLRAGWPGDDAGGLVAAYQARGFGCPATVVGPFGKTKFDSRLCGEKALDLFLPSSQPFSGTFPSRPGASGGSRWSSPRPMTRAMHMKSAPRISLVAKSIVVLYHGLLFGLSNPRFAFTSSSVSMSLPRFWLLFFPKMEAFEWWFFRFHHLSGSVRFSENPLCSERMIEVARTPS